MSAFHKKTFVLHSSGTCIQWAKKWKVMNKNNHISKRLKKNCWKFFFILLMPHFDPSYRKRNSFSKASFNYTFFSFQLRVARESVSWSWTTTRIQASLIEFLPRRETVSKRIYFCHQIGSASLKFKHFDWVIAKLVLILANQMTQIWKISFGKLILKKKLTDDSAHSKPVFTKYSLATRDFRYLP